MQQAAQNSIEHAIIKTICFFDVFEYPLTGMEIWKWLYKPTQPYTLYDVRQALGQAPLLQQQLSLREGFYCLRGREHTVSKRKRNNSIADKKFSHAMKMVRLFSFIPFVRMIAVCNTLAYGNASEESDIDFFIIAKSGRIWLARFFTVLLVKIFARRPKPGFHSDAICLSFFIDERQLDIKQITLGQQDIYTAYWIAQLLPVYDPDGLYKRFFDENIWVKNYLPNIYRNNFVHALQPDRATQIISRIVGLLALPPFIRGYASNFYRRTQTKIIDRNMRSLVNVDTRVIINDYMLKFHSTDRREQYYKAWRDRVTNLIGEYDKSKTATI